MDTALTIATLLTINTQPAPPPPPQHYEVGRPAVEIAQIEPMKQLKLKKKEPLTPIEVKVRVPSGIAKRTGVEPTSSNTYQAGQCTWYVKNRKGNVPNGWGDATNWKSAAISSGWTVSDKPVAGAVGWTYGHVVFVEAVLPNDMVRISEMNYNWIAFSQRTIEIPASKYTYLY